jgi:hypothetical protein
MGANATWDLLNTLTAAVPFFKRVVALVENSFDLRHSTKHTLPNAEVDIAGLVRIYQNGRIYDYHPARRHNGTTKPPKDAITLGFKACDPKYFKEHFKKRWTYQNHASTEEEYSHPPKDTDEDETQTQGHNLRYDEVEEDGILGDDVDAAPDAGEELIRDGLDAFDMAGDYEWPEECNTIALTESGPLPVNVA